MVVSDSINGLLLQAGALGVEIEDDETRAVPGRLHRPTGRATLTATFSRADGIEDHVAATLLPFVSYVEQAKDIGIDWTDLFAEDWNAIFKAHWVPFRLGKRVWIVPSWERDSFFLDAIGLDVPPIVLHLDPGMAFGTGQHETTALCIEAIEEMREARVAVNHLLDVGTGTGILAILAAKWGAKKCRGTDIDPVAIKAALDNARDNGTKLTADDQLPDAFGAVHDVVIANILAGTLIEMVASVIGSVAPSGRLFLSGILQDQEPAVVRVYKAAGMHHVQTVRRGEWVRIDMTKPAGKA
jgi:ribosomal protein L11 methyltransferase